MLTLALSGSLWLSLAPSCSLLLSQAPYCSPNLRTTSSLGSQGPCSARSGAAALQHFLLLCYYPKYKVNNPFKEGPHKRNHLWTGLILQVSKAHSLDIG